jgi:hypothetical protein
MTSCALMIKNNCAIHPKTVRTDSYAFIIEKIYYTDSIDIGTTKAIFR